MNPTPSLGSIIIYQSLDGNAYAALISEIVDAERGVIHLHQFTAHNEKRPVWVQRDVTYDGSQYPKTHTWHWKK
jgi:hypothetical protein